MKRHLLDGNNEDFNLNVGFQADISLSLAGLGVADVTGFSFDFDIGQGIAAAQRMANRILRQMREFLGCVALRRCSSLRFGATASAARRFGCDRIRVCGSDGISNVIVGSGHNQSP